MATTERIDLLNELKVDIVHQVTELDDLETIKEIVDCLHRHAPKKSLVLSQKMLEQLDEDLERGRRDYAEGRWITQDQLQEKIARCRAEKEQ